ncbi:nitric oxide synthase oxygenase, partial [Bacillus sp. WP8]|uniref:nitric oxide synthase oxygenase n=1 Tax=Bacillus sp. WP8 TaxID=756828 RepID=UPI001642CD87
EYHRFPHFRLTCYPLPIIPHIKLHIPPIHYNPPPFNPWYIRTQIPPPNLPHQNHYNILKKLPSLLPLHTTNNSSLSKGKPILELNLALLHSYPQPRL